MKTLVVCKHCSIEGQGLIYKEVEIETSGIYEFKCDHGHENISILQLHSFQLLYDMGIKALLDGYTREAVTSFAVSLERFHEYCIDCFLYDVPKEMKEETWKLVSSQSERQLGAFYYLYLHEINAIPENVKYIKFRNKVVHKGEIPTSEKAFEYAEYVYNYIDNVLNKLYNKYYDDSRFFAFMEKRRTDVKKQFPNHADSDDPTTIQGPTFIDVFPLDENGADRSEYIRSFQEKFQMFEGINDNQSKQGTRRLW